jgi:hypothetical protein
MTSSAETRAILIRYYEGLAKKEGWQFLLSDDVLLTGTVAKESRGRDLFVNNNFFRMFKGLKVRQMIVEFSFLCAPDCGQGSWMGISRTTHFDSPLSS